MKMKCLVAVVMGLRVVLGAASAGAAVEGDRAPRVIKEVLPVYPAKLAKSGIEGWVVVQFVVNKEGRVDDASGVQPPGTPLRTTAYAYNASGSLDTVTTANGIKHAYAYDSLNRLRSLSVSNLSAQLVRANTYTLRASGHRSRITESTGRVADYVYDGLYRLTSETVSGAGPQNGTVSYGLDKVGNRESRSSSVPSVSSVVNSFNSRDWLNTDTYDANGNTRTSSLDSGFGTVTVPDVYDFEDRLILRQRADGSTVGLAYDADGIRVQKTLFDASAQFVASTTYLVCTNNITGYTQVLEEFRNAATGTTATAYTYGSDLISRAVYSSSTSTSNFNWYGYDGLGSVRFLTDASGAVTDTWDYDAFGILIGSSTSTSPFNAYLYRGEQFDADLGQYYLRARFYNQATGRFWNQDTYEGSASDPASLHKYLYAHANPVTFDDPSGHGVFLSSQSVAFSIYTKLLYLAVPVVTVGNRAVQWLTTSRIYHFFQNVSINSLLNASRLQQLYNAAQARYPSLQGWDNHHVLPRFINDAWRSVGIQVPRAWAEIQVRIPNAYHQVIHNEITRAIANYDIRNPAHVDKILKAIEDVFIRYPLP